MGRSEQETKANSEFLKKNLIKDKNALKLFKSFRII